MLKVNILNQNLHILIKSILVCELSQLADFHICVRVYFLLDVFFGLFRAIVHLVDSLAEGLSPLQECIVNQILVQLRPQNHIYLLVVEECYFPFFMAEIFWEVLKVGSLEPLNVI